MILPSCPTKHTIQTSSENGRNASVQLPPPPFWPLLGQKSCYRKSDQTKMGTRTPCLIWTNAVGQCNGLIMHGCPHQTGHVLCHHIIINMGIDDDMIDVILNNQQNSGRLTLTFHGRPDFCCRNHCRCQRHSQIVWWIVVCLHRRGRPQPSSSSSASSISLPPPSPFSVEAAYFLV